MKYRFAIAINIGLLLLSGAQAQVPAGSPANPVIESTPGKIFRVDTGIVEVKLGVPFDISAKKIMLIFDAINGIDTPKAFAEFRVLNSRYTTYLGGRFDIKYNTNIKELPECNFDVIGLKAPKGATPSVVIRIDCD